jgi:hypothetical protein
LSLLPEKPALPESFLDSYTLYRNLHPADLEEEFVAINNKTGLRLNGSVAARIKKEMLLNKDRMIGAMAAGHMIRVLFDPFKESGVINFDDENYTNSDLCYNTYRVPKWKSFEFSGEYPKAFVDLCEHVFPVESQRRNVLAWAFHSLHNRSEISLVMLGNQGVGKTTFAYSLFSLVGMDLVTEPTNRFFDGSFNGEFSGKKFAFFDEVVCRGDAHKNKLKRNMNDMIMIEGKNQNPHHVKNYMSFIFACNHARLLEIEPRDRRFYAPDLGTKRVTDKIVAAVKKGWEDPQFQRDMYEYFEKERNENFDFFNPDKNTKAYWEMVRQGSPAPIKHVFRTLEKHENEWVTYQQLADTWETKRAANVLFPDFDELSDFLSEYKPLGVKVIEIDYELSSLKFNSFGQTKDEEIIEGDEEWTLL